MCVHVMVRLSAQHKNAYIYIPENLSISLGALHEARSMALGAGVQVGECCSVPIRVMPLWRVPEKHAVIDTDWNGFSSWA